MNRGRARGGNVGFGFGRGRGGSRGGGGGNQNNDSESLTACIPQGIDWHASEPPKDYIFGQGRGEEGFTTGIVRPIDNPLEILRNQRRAQELAEKNKNGGALSEVSTILDAADAAAREDERRARIQALTGQHQNQQGNTNNNNNSNNNKDEEQLISAIPEVGKIMVDAGERKDRERERRMEAADVVDLLLPSTNASSMLMVSSADQNRSREAILEKLKQSSKNSTTSTTMKNPSSKDVRDLLVGVTTGSSSHSTGEDENNSGDATEEEISSGGVEFDKIMIGNMNSNYDPESLKGYRRLTENSILRDPKSSEQEFLKLAQIDIIESGGDVRAGYQTILRGTKETGGHSSLLWLTAAKFANDFFNDNIRAKELCKTGLMKMMENLMSASVLIPREPSAKNYAIMINFVNYAIELFSASTTSSASHSNDESSRNNNNNNNNNNTTSSIAEEEKQDERNMEVLEILRQAVVLAPLHDPFWEQLFFLEDASQHREILTVSMKSIRESKLKIPVTLWVRLAKLEMKLVTQNDHDGQQQQKQQQLNRVKKVTEAGLKDHPSSPALWLIQAIAMTKMEGVQGEHNQQQEDVATSNTTAAVTKSLKSAVDAVFDSQRQNNNNHHHPHHLHQDMTLMFKSWFTTCLDLVSLSSSTSSNEDKITNDIKSELMNRSTCSSTSFITRIAIREFLIKVFCTSKNTSTTGDNKEDDSSNHITNDDISLMEALRAVTEDPNFFPSSSSPSILSPASAPSTVIQSRMSFLNKKKNTQQKQNQKHTPEILSRLNLSILVFETLIELVINNPQQPNASGTSRFTLLRHFETVLRSLSLCVDHHVLVNDSDDNMIDKILTRLLSSLLMLSSTKLSSSSNKIFLNACSAVKLFLQQSDEEARFSKILSACNNTHDDENAKEVLELTKRAFGLASSSSSSRTANTNTVLKQENKEDAAEDEHSSLRIQQHEENRLFNFYYEKAIQFTHLLTSQEFNTTNTNNNNLTSLVENLTKIEEDIKTFVSSSSSLVSSSPVSIVNHLVYRTQLLSSIRTAKWQVEELMMMTKNSNIDPPPISFEDLLENNIVDISYDCRLVLHSILFLSNRSSSSSSSSFKSKAILDQQIQLVEGKVTRAIDEKEAMIRQNAPTDRIQACMIVIQRKTNTLCHLIATRVFFDKDDPVNRIRVMDRFASSSKTVWRRGVLASFSRCRRSFETSSSSLSSSHLSSLFSIDPLLLLVQKSNSTLIQSLKSNFDKNCLFASSSATLDSSAVTTRSLLLFPPSTATPYDGTNCRPGLPSLDLLMRLFIEVTPAGTSSSSSGGSGNAKAAVLKNQMSFIKEIAMSNPNAFNTAAASSPPPFPLLYLAASDLYTKAGKHERAVQEACKALDAAFEMNSHKPTSLLTLLSSSSSSNRARHHQNEEFEDCQSFTPSSFDSIFGSTSGLEFVTEIVWKKNVIVKIANNGGISRDQELEKVISNIECCLAQGF